MRDKTIYSCSIAISEKDLNHIRELKKLNNKMSLAGVLSKIINKSKSLK